jgi:Periplasmic component of the Tol biopolymer transport system
MMDENGFSKKILTPVGGYCIRPKWSPEGNRILYLRGIYMGAIIATSIVDTNGNSFDIQIAPESRVFEGDSVFYNLQDSQWHSDGAHLFVWGNVGSSPSSPVLGEDTNAEIFLLDISTGQITGRLTRNHIDEAGFEISSDDTRIALVRGAYQTNRRIYLMSLSDTSAQPITLGNNDNWPRWSKDGTLIVFLKDENGDPNNVSYALYSLAMDSFQEKRISVLNANEPDAY